jgi:hypothetical protein
VKRRKDVRIFVAVVVGFILYRITVEFMNRGSAAFLGLLAAGATWELIALVARHESRNERPGRSDDGDHG